MGLHQPKRCRAFLGSLPPTMRMEAEAAEGSLFTSGSRTPRETVSPGPWGNCQPKAGTRTGVFVCCYRAGATQVPRRCHAGVDRYPVYQVDESTELSPPPVWTWLMLACLLWQKKRKSAQKCR